MNPPETPAKVIWHEPPPTGKYAVLMASFMEQLRAEPGAWGELGGPPEGYPISLATNMRRADQRKEFEIRTVTVAGNRVRLYARFKDVPALKSVGDKT